MNKLERLLVVIKDIMSAKSDEAIIHNDASVSERLQNSAQVDYVIGRLPESLAPSDNHLASAINPYGNI